MRVVTALPLITATLAAFALPTHEAQASGPSRTLAVVIGSNAAPDAQTEPLNYADDDAARWAEMLSAMSDEVFLLTRFDAPSTALYGATAPVLGPPTRANLESALGRVADAIDAAQRKGQSTRLFLVFVGHGVLDASRMGAVVLEDGQLPRTALMALLAPLDRLAGHRTHLVIDACNAWFMVHDRGARLADWRDDRSGESWARETESALRAGLPPHLGLILSTSGAQQSHETANLTGGVFSHEVRSALSGAADADGDGRVTYDELHAFLRAAGASIQHAQAPSIFVRPPEGAGVEALAAIEDFRAAAVLSLPSGMNGHFRLVDDRGLPYAELNRAGDGPGTALAIIDRGTGAYELHRQRPGAEADVALVPVHPGARIDASTLAFGPPEKQASRGLLDDAYRNGLFATPYGVGIVNLVRTISGESAVLPGPMAPVRGPRITVDGGALMAGGARPGGTPTALGVGATMGFGVEVISGLRVGPRVQYDQAEVDGGDVKHFMGGVEAQIGLLTAGSFRLGVAGLVGIDMVAGTRSAQAGDAAQFDPDNVTGQLQLDAGLALAEHFALRILAGYAVTGGVRLAFADGAESGLLHRPIGGLRLEVVP